MIYRVEVVGIEEPRKYIVFYNYNERKREFIGVDKLPNTVKKFMENSNRKFALKYARVNDDLVIEVMCYDNN